MSMAKRNKILSILSAVITIGLLSGCGKTEKTDLDNGLASVTLQEYDDALDFLKQAEQNEEDLESVYRAEGLAYMGLRDYANAADSFKKALSYAGTKTGEAEKDINYYLALCYAKQDDYEAAIERLDAVSALDPSDETAALERGKLKLYMNDKAGAKADFDLAAGADKGHAGVYIDIYDVYSSKGLEKDGAEYLEAARTADPEKMDDYDKARLCYYTYDLEGACHYLEYARSIGKADSDMIRLLGHCYRELDKYENATAIYLGYLEDHAEPEICNELGISYAEEGDYTKALDAFRMGINMPEDNTCMQELKRNEIVCLENLKNYKEAAELASVYITQYGEDPDMVKELAFLSTR